jgi:hypothetical protein
VGGAVSNSVACGTGREVFSNSVAGALAHEDVTDRVSRGAREAVVGAASSSSTTTVTDMVSRGALEAVVGAVSSSTTTAGTSASSKASVWWHTKARGKDPRRRGQFLVFGRRRPTGDRGLENPILAAASAKPAAVSAAKPSARWQQPDSTEEVDSRPPPPSVVRKQVAVVRCDNPTVAAAPAEPAAATAARHSVRWHQPDDAEEVKADSRPLPPSVVRKQVAVARRLTVAMSRLKQSERQLHRWNESAQLGREVRVLRRQLQTIRTHALRRRRQTVPLPCEVVGEREVSDQVARDGGATDGEITDDEIGPATWSSMQFH